MNIYKGNIIFSARLGTLDILKQGFLVVDEKGTVVGTYEKLPREYAKEPLTDYGNQLIIPAFTDLHLHPNQYPNMGLGYDMELMPWIESYATPSGEYFKDPKQAKKIWNSFLKDIWKFGLMRTVLFGPLDVASTDLLFEMYIQTGMSCYLGKNHTDYKKDKHDTETTDQSMAAARYLIDKWEGKSDLVHYMLTPSFAPGCTEELMKWVGEVARAEHIPVQSHLDENRTEVQMVKNRFHTPNYAQVYMDCNMFGGDIPTVMAHCIHTTEDEIQLLRSQNIYVAHCVHSNLDLASGIMPLRRYLEEGIHVGLGSDISGGHTLNMMDTMRMTIEASKVYFVTEGKQPVTTAEAFYLATKGGGSFFGKVGSFEPGYAFDALVIDDDAMKDYRGCSLEERLERFIYNGDERQIKERYCNGKLIPEPGEE